MVGIAPKDFLEFVQPSVFGNDGTNVMRLVLPRFYLLDL